MRGIRTEIDRSRFLHAARGGWRLLLLSLVILPVAARDDPGSTVPPRMQTLDNERKLTIGDRVMYQVLEEREEPVTLYVDGEGRIQIPLIGPVNAAGKTPFRVALEVKDQLEQEYFYQATVILIRERIRSFADG